ncbi:MAG: hypothetical protein QOI91_170 [Solirubrobacteraceae bacterium]|nr:hypothetical protein [Solirubrobacteraceae bacterium]
MTLLDDALPRFDVHEVHDTWVSAPPDAVWAAVMQVTPLEIRLLVPLMALRVAPGLLARGRRPAIHLRAPVLDGFLGNGFLVLAERKGEELVVGAAGRFWQIRGAEGVRRLRSPDAFASFDEPASARTAMNFTLRPETGGTRVRTETRIVGTDADGTRAFRRYWRAIALGSSAIRVSWLNAIRRRAERR